MSTPTPRTDEMSESLLSKTFLTSYVTMQDLARTLERELAAEREKVRVLHSALQNLVDEQNGAPLETRREEWQEAMDEACAALAAKEDTE